MTCPHDISLVGSHNVSRHDLPSCSATAPLELNSIAGCTCRCRGRQGCLEQTQLLLVSNTALHKTIVRIANAAGCGGP